MAYGGFAYGATALGGSIVGGCTPPRANLVVMDQLGLSPGNVDLDKLSKSIDDLLKTF